MNDEEIKPVTVCPNGKTARQIAEELWNGPAQDMVDVADVARVYANKMNAIPNAAKEDLINKPNHYRTGKVECIDCIESVVSLYSGEFAFLAGQVVKYLYRANSKGTFTQDLKKAQYYMNRLVKLADKRFIK